MSTIGFYEDDEGMCCDILLESFGPEPVQVINLECYALEEKFKGDVSYLVDHQWGVRRAVFEAAAGYVRSQYNADDCSFSLMKIYVSHDQTQTFGLLFRWDGDAEHGIGVSIKVDKVVKVGPAEVSFI
ncbi:hypothetical protein [Pseudomonas sp. NUPR-001]|uniref:hypothetical protein n=1 Tax=Pseudomonas sp. NUPR-001 TaxID=3416058 RepID=UPI003F9A61C0